MSMVKRATGKIEKFTDAEGQEVEVENKDVVWADEKADQKLAKDELVIPSTTSVDLDPNATDDDESVIAKDC
jgi:hypothetical protein